MDARELSWRGRVAARSALQRAASSIRSARWHRSALASALSADAEIGSIRDAVRRGDWLRAHHKISLDIAQRPSSFLIAPADRAAVSDRIRLKFPDAAADATAGAEQLVRGEYDLLGYVGLVFHDANPRDPRDVAALPDWHYDPVHARRAPRRFWAGVPFLDPSCGDHKIIWELNRHQHWMALGRAYWLTGDHAYRRRCVSELEHWLAENPPLIGINWASMLELAFRSISWIWALHFFAGSSSEPDDIPWTVDLLVGLDRQLTHIEQNLSYYFSPNTHLLGEALSLYVAGRCVPQLAASTRRAHTGRRILVDEIGRQIARDGGHCERSTHYHRYTLDFYVMALAVARITRDPIAGLFERAVTRLATAARVLCDDWGRAPHLGDDDGGMLLPIAGRAPDDWSDSLTVAALLSGRRDLQVGPEPEEAHWILAHRAFGASLAGAAHLCHDPEPPVIRSAALPDTGYYVSRAIAAEHLVIDGGPHGYRNAGHAHADALSMTLSIRGRPLLVDPGTGCYTIDARLRDRFRSTELHNTVIIDGRPQSTAGAPFQWIRHADATTHRWRTTSTVDYFDGSHDGYAPVTHRRRVLVIHDDLIVVADHVDDPARASHMASAHWHVDPAWAVEIRDQIVTFQSRYDHAALVVPQGQIASFAADVETGLGWQSPTYGRLDPATTITVSHTAAAPFWLIGVFDLNPLDPIREAVLLPVWAEAGTMAHATGLRIARSGSIDFVLFAEPASAASRHTWRVAELETDARMLFCTVDEGELSRLALVDGSIVKGAGRRAIGLVLGHSAPALYVDKSTIRKYTPCAASPAL
jgi:hypothetical protein